MNEKKPKKKSDWPKHLKTPRQMKWGKNSEEREDITVPDWTITKEPPQPLRFEGDRPKERDQ